jgi:hypothetical protein
VRLEHQNGIGLEWEVFSRMLRNLRKSLSHTNLEKEMQQDQLGKYAIVKHQNHAELAYILEILNDPGEAQIELGIEKEASYVISDFKFNYPLTGFATITRTTFHINLSILQ